MSRYASDGISDRRKEVTCDPILKESTRHLETHIGLGAGATDRFDPRQEVSIPHLLPQLRQCRGPQVLHEEPPLQPSLPMAHSLSASRLSTDVDNMVSRC